MSNHNTDTASTTDSTSNTPKILRVAVPTPLRRLFDYRPKGPSPTGGWQPGIRVRVPFGSRQLVAIIVECTDSSDFDLAKIKPITERIDDEPLPADWLWLCRFTARYYQHALGDTLHSALPVLLRQGKPLEARTRERWRLAQPLEQITPQLKRAQKQRALVELLDQHRNGLVTSAITAQDFTRAQLNALLQKQLISVETEPTTAPNQWKAPLLAEPSLPLNREQAVALSALHEKLNAYHPCLLHGITGSGKTEVYLQLIESVINQGRQALILVPEIGLTPQTLMRFRKRFRAPVVALHSGLNDNERLDAWEAAKSGRAPIIIGTRSAIFTPLAKPGVIIVDEEHDTSFKQQDGLRYNARDLAIARAHKSKIPILLASATPSLESLAHARAGTYRHLRLTQRPSSHPPAKLELVDMKGRPQQGGLIAPTLEAIKLALNNQGQVLVFINRRGFSPTLACNACGWMAQCRSCDARLTLHREPARLICHHCEQQAGLPDCCPDCGSADLRPLGAGTERTEETLAALFPKTPVHRIDRDSMRRKHSLDNVLEEIHRGEPCILVGTQMLAKGHHLPHVSLVVVVNADAGLYASDFRALEQSAQLLVQVAGRAGRAHLAGRVLVQTLHPNDDNLRTLSDNGYDALANLLLEERRITALPPFRFIALLRFEAVQEAEATQQALSASDALKAWHCSREVVLDILGPVPAPMERRQNRYHVQLMLSSDKRSSLHEAASFITAWLENEGSRRVRWSLDIDPISLS